jgi:AraC-like DNA-binding protein
MPLRPQLVQPECFEAVLASRGVGALVLNRIQAGAGHGMECLRANTGPAGMPGLLVLSYLKGQARVLIAGGPGTAVAERELQVRPGQPVILDERQGCSIRQPGPVDLLVLAVPLALIDAHGDAAQHLLAGHLSDCASLRLLMQQMQLLDAWQGPLPEAEAAMLSDLVVGTLRTVLQAGSDVARARHNLPMCLLLRRVRQLIARQYPDPQLGPERVAQRLGISVRTLQARLAREGTSLSAELMAYRLERARHLLRGATSEIMGIKEVSLRCGFSSPAHFSRRFRARYGSAPAGLLRDTP